MNTANELSKTPIERLDSQAKRACEKARKLERAGDYEGARSALRDLWVRIGDRPMVDHLSEYTQAEVLMRVGSVAGWLGCAKQIPGAQEFARDRLTESIRLFESLGQSDNRAQAMTDLALCYWRSGQHDEARVVFRDALGLAQESETKLRTLVNASIVEISSGRYNDALSLLNNAADLLEEVSDDATHGRYHGQRALVYRNLGNLDDALVEYSAASMYFANVGHVRYLAGVENNIGFILLRLGRRAESLKHLDKARTVFASIKDAGMVAQVNETRARLFIAEKMFAEAERAVLLAITVFEQSEEYSLLAEALITYGIALAGRRRYDNARKAFHRASDVAAAAGDLRLAAVAQLTMMEEIRDILSREELLAAYKSADENLGNAATQSDLERLRLSCRIIFDSIDMAGKFQEELIGGTLEEELFHFEARLILRALEQENGSVTGAARVLGLTHQGLSGILAGRHSKTLGSARKPKRDRRKSTVRKK
jgi:tetratricopeptide (TPR) repeat protein